MRNAPLRFRRTHSDFAEPRVEAKKSPDILFVLAIVLAPMTGLRFGKVGPAEVLIAAWCMVELFRGARLSAATSHMRYWTLFLGATTLGAAIGGMFYPAESTPGDLVTWLYFAFISVVSFAALRGRSFAALMNIFRTMAVIGTVWYSFLFVYSRLVSVSFLGAPLWYGYGARFAGGGKNPHQVALLLSVLVFAHVSLFLSQPRVRGKVLHAALFAASLGLGQATKSSSFWIAIALTAGGLAFYSVLKVTKDPRQKLGVSLIFAAGLLAACAWWWAELMAIGLNFIESDPNGLNRFEIWASIGETLSISPVFGLGPGTHGQGGSIEYHSTYLEVLAMSGVVGLVLFLGYSLLVLKRVARLPLLLFTALPLFIYGVSGFTARRLVYWLVLMLLLALAESDDVSRMPLKGLGRQGLGW